MPTDAGRTPFARRELDDEGLARSTLAGGAHRARGIDLDPVVGARIAAASRARTCRRGADVPRWPHADAVLPSGELIGALVDESKPLQAVTDAPHVVFVLDGERSVHHRSSRRPRIDNRYDLAVGDLPTLRQLRRAGIERIVKLAPRPRHEIRRPPDRLHRRTRAPGIRSRAQATRLQRRLVGPGRRYLS